jgi:Fe-S-cluster containining protein
VLRSDGTRRVLKQQPNEDCCFLGSQGCRLTVDERPLVCRLYPFDYTADGLAESPAPGCPLYLLEEGEELIEAIGMRRGQAEVWRKQLYEEITLELKEIER